MKPLRTLLILLLSLLPHLQAELSPLAEKPDWQDLGAYQHTMTREEFVDLMTHVYAPGADWQKWFQLGTESVSVVTSPGHSPFVLHFAADKASAQPPPIFWRPRASLPAPPSGQPLAGVHIALDPGHLGGRWAKMEERWFQIGDSKPVTEGDMTLRVAQLIKARLEALGAKVSLTRSKTEPLTSRRPDQLRQAAVSSLRSRGDEVTRQSVQKESEKLFYRTSEIRRRAVLVNEKLRPDLVLCLHFNAEAWGNEHNPTLTDKNHLHFLITGAWSNKELGFEDQRYELLEKLLSRSFREELAATNSISRAMARDTGLPPYTYEGGAVTRVNDNPYVWARNLLANRLFTCPVVYVEPYVMNSRTVFRRIQAGEYEGLKKFDGVPRKNIFAEYADSVTAGLVDYYGNR